MSIFNDHNFSGHGVLNNLANLSIELSLICLLVGSICSL